MASAEKSPKKASAKKAPKVKKERFKTIKQIVAAYKVVRPRDPRLPWWMLIAGVGAAAVLYLLFLLWFDNFWIPILPALLVGVLAALILFSSRARKLSFAQAEGQAGAAAWALNNMRGDWRVYEAVAGNNHADLVHRVIGKPGIVLVSEGNVHRVKALVASEKKRLSRVVGDTPIYDVHVGDDEGQVPLKKLERHVQKLPRNVQPAAVRALDKRLKAVGAPRMPMPQGPLPKGKQMAVSTRQMKRRTGQ